MVAYGVWCGLEGVVLGWGFQVAVDCGREFRPGSLWVLW